MGIECLLKRHEDLGIRPIRFEVIAHPKHDPAVPRSASDFLRLYLRVFNYALVVFDREGYGGERKSRSELESEVESRLEANGWDGRCAALVIDPELDLWLWNSAQRVERLIG